MRKRKRCFGMVALGGLAALLTLGAAAPATTAWADGAAAVAAGPEARGAGDGGDASDENCEHLAGEWQAMLVNGETNKVDEFFAINLVGDANAKLRINPDNAVAPSLSLPEGTLIVEGGLGIDWSNGGYDGPYGYVTSYQMGNIPVRVPEGKKLVSLTLTINSVDEGGYVSKATLTPEYEQADAAGVVVADKNAQMNIPVLDAGNGAPVARFSAAGVLNGSGVPQGSRVYISWNPLGGQDFNMGYGFTLMVDGKPVTSDFGSITVTVPVVYREAAADGKVHEVTVETSDGSKTASAIAVTKDATVAASLTNSANSPFEVWVSVGKVVEGGSSGDDNVTQPPTVEVPVVSGDTGITASGTLSGANIPEGAQVALSAAELSAGNADYDRLVAAMGSGKLAGVYDVSMLVNGSEIHNGFGELTLTMPVDAAYNGHWVTVWHLHTDGTITSERVVAKDGAVTFTVTDLSSFALEIGELAETGGDAAEAGDKLPQTGDPTAFLSVLAVSGAALSGAGAFISRRKNGIL